LLVLEKADEEDIEGNVKLPKVEGSGVACLMLAD